MRLNHFWCTGPHRSMQKLGLMTDGGNVAIVVARNSADIGLAAPASLGKVLQPPSRRSVFMGLSGVRDIPGYQDPSSRAVIPHEIPGICQQRLPDDLMRNESPVLFLTKVDVR
jgi:hypothetical protein